MNFDEAFEKLLGHEGGLVENPADPGGLTKFGISQRAYPGEDIRGLTVERAKLLYRRDYWGPAGCDAVPDVLKASLFDTAVNAGVSRAVKLLQASVDVVQDGKLGPQTLQACQSMPASRLVARFQGNRLLFLADLPGWSHFSKGWTRRVASYLLEA